MVDADVRTDRTVRLAMWLLVATTAVVFLPSLGAEFVWDDWTLIVHNEYAHDTAHLGRALTSGFWDISSSDLPKNPSYATIYRPVVKALQLLEWVAFDGSPFGFHFVNVLLHVACVAMAFVFVRRRLRSTGTSAAVAAAIGAAVFALHPTRPETVTWVSGMTDLVMTTFALGAALAFDRGERPAHVAIACVLLALSVLSKEPAILVPIAIGLDLVLLRPDDATARDALRRVRAPLAALGLTAAAAFALRFAFVSSPSSDLGQPTDVALRFAASIGHYALSTVWPLSPSTHVGIRAHDADLTERYDPTALGAALVLAALLVALVVLSRRKPWARAYLADAVWLCLPLLPVANLVPIGHYALISERFLYLPHVGLAALVARALLPLFDRSPAARTATLVAAGAAVLGLGVATLDHEAHFVDERSLWQYEAARNPSNLVAWVQLAELDRRANRFDEALALLARAHDGAVAAHDRVREVETTLSAASTELLLLSDADQDALGETRAFYESILRGAPAELDAPPFHARLTLEASERRAVLEDVEGFRVPYATSLVRTLALERAAEVLEAIVADDPRAASAWNMLAIVRARELDFAGAHAAIAAAEERLPGYVTLTRTHAAIEEAEQAVAGVAGDAGDAGDAGVAGDAGDAGDDAERALAIASAQIALGSPEAARRALAPALAREPTRPALVMARARADVADRRFDLARATLERAKAMDPAHAADWDRALASLDEVARRSRGAPSVLDDAR